MRKAGASSACDSATATYHFVVGHWRDAEPRTTGSRGALVFIVSRVAAQRTASHHAAAVARAAGVYRRRSVRLIVHLAGRLIHAVRAQELIRLVHLTDLEARTRRARVLAQIRVRRLAGIVGRGQVR